MWNQLKLHRLLFAIALILASLVIGVAGYSLIEQYTLGEAFYMTVITVSTVGYMEVRPLSHEGKLFTSIYILFNIGTVAYTVSVVSTYLFEGELRAIWKSFMNEREIQKFKNHVIVCGFGRNGQRAVRELLACHETVVVIELDKDLASFRTLENERLRYLPGNATEDEVLELAGVRAAKALISTLPKDADNVFVTLTARGLNPQLQIVSRASEKNTEQKLKRAGANNVVMPDEIGGSHMANLVIRPEVIHFLELLGGDGPNSMNLEEIYVDQLRPECQNRSIKELDVHNRTGATLIGINREREGYLISPESRVCLQPGDVLILLGPKSNIKAFREQYM